jgi:hypothetical protein
MQEASCDPLVANSTRVHAVLSDAVSAHLAAGKEGSCSHFFESDEECMGSCELLLELEQVIFDCGHALKERAINPGGKLQIDEELQDAILIVDNLCSLLAKLHASHLIRFSASKATRLSQLAGGLKLTQNEVLAVVFIAMRNTGRLGSEAYERRGVLRNMSLFAQIDGRQLMDFVTSDREHLKQAVFEIDDGEWAPSAVIDSDRYKY